MLTLLDTASRWLHLVATLVWLGGISFLLLVAIPSARRILGPAAGELLNEISRRFTKLANASIALLLVTGAVMMALAGRPGGAPAPESAWSLTLVVKHALFLIMVLVHFFRGLALAPRIRRITEEAEKQALARLSLNLVKLNWGLGMLVLLLSSLPDLP